ncbi:hypothetical protein D9613_010632 [Agrocybe pediades]|uniref:pyranose dehydrogenase (acceptor) n=1 Tax=Agrocybe pediades TaxID=84607 RepID=A0A8H4QGK8_9AGAR|nr:hypothetical protein D9613_010632 [Agrocybe pediades]
MIGISRLLHRRDLMVRGHLLGGSSSVNGMVYTRGSSSDYDRFARVTGEPGWSWNALQPYIRKHEGFVPPVDGRNPAGEFDPRFHGFSGPIHTTLQALLNPPIDSRMIAAANQLKGEFSFNLDLNSGTPLGLAWHQSTTGHGERSSAATGYLPASVRARPNLHILIGTRVTRVLPTSGDRQGKPSLRTVEFTSGTSNSSPRTTVTATKEVILSAGSIGTPHILLHSGIGDKSELKKIGIASVVNLPSVDHPIFAVAVNLNITNDNDPWANIDTNTTLQAEALEIWNSNRTGPLASFGRLDQFIFGRVPPSKFKGLADPSSGPNSAHYELAFTGSANLLLAAVAVSSPASRGTVSLQTNNPFDQPLIDPQFLTAPIDVILAREAIRAFFKFTTAPAWKDVLLSPTPGFVNNTVDSVLDEFSRNTTIANLHPIGTAAMSPVNAPWGVVDPDLLLKKASGLRIIDASVYPYIPCGHTQASVYIVAERAADVVKATWRA